MAPGTNDGQHPRNFQQRHIGLRRRLPDHVLDSIIEIGIRQAITGLFGAAGGMGGGFLGSILGAVTGGKGFVTYNAPAVTIGLGASVEAVAELRRALEDDGRRFASRTIKTIQNVRQRNGNI